MPSVPQSQRHRSGANAAPGVRLARRPPKATAGNIATEAWIERGKELRLTLDAAAAGTSWDEFVRAQVVVLAASACESARILLNSKSPRHPQGLANASGVVNGDRVELVV